MTRSVASCSEKQATNVRALAARANFLALDRPDVAYATKGLCPPVARPTSVDVLALKQTVRYLQHHRQLIYCFNWEPGTVSIDVYVDTDFACCQETRRGTSGGVVLIGGHLLKHWSTTQPPIALRSGEAGRVGILEGASQGLGFQSLASDLGLQLNLHAHSDSSAAICISRRRGLGKVKHIHVGDLWMQERLRNQDCSLDKMLGCEHPADVFTKFTDGSTIINMRSKMNLAIGDGRANSAPQISMIQRSPLCSVCTRSRKLC